MSDLTNDNTGIDSPSRRGFLGISSVALATAALTGLTASAQETAEQTLRAIQFGAAIDQNKIVIAS